MHSRLNSQKGWEKQQSTATAFCDGVRERERERDWKKERKKRKGDIEREKVGPDLSYFKLDNSRVGAYWKRVEVDFHEREECPFPGLQNSKRTFFDNIQWNMRQWSWSTVVGGRKVMNNRVIPLSKLWAFYFKAGSHFTANLLPPAIDSCKIENFPIFRSDLQRPSPLRQSQGPATSVNEPLEQWLFLSYRLYIFRSKLLTRCHFCYQSSSKCSINYIIRMNCRKYFRPFAKLHICSPGNAFNPLGQFHWSFRLVLADDPLRELAP